MTSGSTLWGPLAAGAAAWVALAAAGVIGISGLVSALQLLRARRGIDAALVAVAAVALAVLVSDLTTLRSAPGSGSVAVDDNILAPAAGVALVTLDFPRQLALGRPFEFTLQRSLPLAGWRLQLLDENGKLLAQAAADAAGKQASVRWLPPLAEIMVLQARALDASGRVLEQGPVPLQVQAGAPLQVQGRAGAPSFDVQVLNSLLVGSDALVDWQITLGKTVTRTETARSAMAAPDLLVIDAAHFEQASAPARAALLARVAQGLPLLVLAANASNPALWARELQLPLLATEGEVTRTPGPDAAFVLPLTALAPGAGAATRLGPWTANHPAQPWMWQRPWQAGRISWLGVSDWHRAAISAPQALGAWWQTVLDQAGVRHASQWVWHVPDAMPRVGERTRVCVRGTAGVNAAVAVELPGLAQGLHLQRRDDVADAACAAFWPQQAGWQRLQVADASAPPAALYVYGADDWLPWRRALRGEARAVDALRALPAAATVPTPLPAWPWGLACTAAMLALWWRERR